MEAIVLNLQRSKRERITSHKSRVSEILPQECASGINSHPTQPICQNVDPDRCQIDSQLATLRRSKDVTSSLVLQNAKLLPLATPIPCSALAALPVESIFGALLLRRRFEKQATFAQTFGVVEEYVGFVLVHLTQNDDVGWVAL